MRFSFKAPTIGWARFGDISINKSIKGPQGAEAIIFWTGFPDGQNADPCPRLLGGPIGPSAVDLATAVAAAPGTEFVAEPADVTVGGLPAKQVVLKVREESGCKPGFFFRWDDVALGPLWPVTIAGDTINVWIIEVNGKRLVIEAETTTQANRELKREVQQIIGSIRFE